MSPLTPRPSRQHALHTGTSLDFIKANCPGLITLVSDGTAASAGELQALIDEGLKHKLESRACEVLRLGEMDGNLFGMLIREAGALGVEADDPLDSLLALVRQDDGLRKANSILKKAREAPSNKAFTFAVHRFSVRDGHAAPTIATIVARLESQLTQDFLYGHTVCYEASSRSGTYVVLAWSNRGRKASPVIDGGLAERQLERGAKAIRFFIDFNERFVAIERRALPEGRWLERICDALQPEIDLSRTPSPICHLEALSADRLLAVGDIVVVPPGVADVEEIELIRIQWTEPDRPDMLALSSPGGVQHYLRGLLDRRANIKKLEFRVTVAGGQRNTIELASSTIKIDQIFFNRVWDFLRAWGILGGA